MSKKNKFLYFAKSAPDGTTSTEEVAMFSVDRLSHFEMANATDMKIYFESNQEVNKDVDNAVVSLDITSGKHKEIMAELAREIAYPDGNAASLIVVADSENGVYLHNDITACASVVVVEAA